MRSELAAPAFCGQCVDASEERANTAPSETASVKGKRKMFFAGIVGGIFFRTGDYSRRSSRRKGRAPFFLTVVDVMTISARASQGGSCHLFPEVRRNSE